ncbi:MAG: hypothetical protein ACLQBQ_09810 [Smithella sp.]
MNQEKMDQEWQQMQSRINQLVGRYLKDDYSSIEDRSRSADELPTSSDYNDHNSEDAA